jgi:acetyl esterase/lipase
VTESTSQPANTPPGVRHLLDPELQPILGSFELPPLDLESLTMMRSASFATPGLSDAVERIEHLVPGDPPVRVRVHRAKSERGVRPAIVTMHGGGYLIGSYEMDDTLLQQWCQSLGIVGVSVDYRLAPETPYPGPLEDCYAALQWTHQHADELGIDPARIGIYGLSAGGGLAAALALLARDRGEFPVAFQLLDCPMLDDRQDTLSIQAEGLFVWDFAANQLGWRSYLGDRYGAADLEPYAAAARATDLVGLPPTCIVVGSIDGFRDEDVAYAQRLNQAGVPCELHVIAGLPHAYLIVPGAAAVQLAGHCTEDWLRRQLR